LFWKIRTKPFKENIIVSCIDKLGLTKALVGLLGMSLTFSVCCLNFREPSPSPGFKFLK